ncbi:hypothetical protein CFELI_00370 [Corynebacterium felinum]|nr:hypothetical protein CFELI_00370 [Corynebacterium felinum]
MPTPDDQRTPPHPPGQRDQRAIIQADKLRTELLLKALRFGQVEPLTKPRTVKLFLGSVILGAVGIVATIGTATILQLL